MQQAFNFNTYIGICLLFLLSHYVTGYHLHQNVWAFYSFFHLRFSKYFKRYHPGDNAKHYIYFTERSQETEMEKAAFVYVRL